MAGWMSCLDPSDYGTPAPAYVRAPIAVVVSEIRDRKLAKKLRHASRPVTHCDRCPTRDPLCPACAAINA